MHGWPETPSGDWRLARLPEAIGTQEHVESEERIMPKGRQSRPGPIPTEDVIKKTLSGIVKAQKDYEAWSGGYWLWKAPEYMLTMYIAKEIWAIPGSKYLTLESKVRENMSEAGGFGRGRLSENVRPDGRSDITLYWAGETPRAIIEVKNQIETINKIKDDIDRISTMLRNADSTFQFGLIAFYTSCKDRGEDGKRAKSTIEERLERIESETRDILDILGKEYRLSRHDAAIKVDGDSAWVASVLKIQLAG